MQFPETLKYTDSHEWIEDLGGGRARIGLSDFAQDALGDIVFVDLPAVGDTVTAGETFGDVESVKAVSEIISPASGTVAAVNEELSAAPEKINEAPYAAWLIKLENVTDTAALLDAPAYRAVCKM